MTYVCVMAFVFLSVMVVNLVTTRVGVGAVTVTLGPISLPETTVTGGGVIVDVVSMVTATVAVEVMRAVLVIMGYAAVSVALTVTTGSSGARFTTSI